MPDKRRYYISNARLLDGTGKDHGEQPHALLVAGAVIEAVAPQSELARPEDAVLLDAGGMTLMPGMIDCHDHLAAISGSWRDRSQISPTLGVLTVARTLGEMLLTGFTSVRDAGGLDAGLKEAVERGMIPGPRLRISVNLLCQTGGHNHHIEPARIDRDFPKLPYLPDGICDGPDMCRRKAREMIFAGADWVKFCTTGGISSRTGGPLLCQFTREEVRAIVDAAHTAGKPAMVHAYGGEGIDIALEAGVDSIEHGAALTEAQIERMAKQGTWLVPTFAVFRKVLAIQAEDPSVLPDYVSRKAAELLERQAKSFPMAMAAGLKIALGTDLGPFEHNRNAVEFGHMVAGGMTPMQAIVAGTGAAADCIGLGDKVGVLRAGMLADLLLVDGDPLRDIRVLENADKLRLIMQDGRIVKHEAARQLAA
jgi:imidazolonepropionase-like amidohydrolase